jgi:hypothetical protein
VADQVADEIRAELSGDTSADWTLRLLTALGGKVNLRSAVMHSPRIIIDVTDGTLVDKPVDKRTRDSPASNIDSWAWLARHDRFKIAVNVVRLLSNKVRQRFCQRTVKAVRQALY